MRLFPRTLGGQLVALLAIALVVSLVVACAIFLFVRTRGGDYPGPR